MKYIYFAEWTNNTYGMLTFNQLIRKGRKYKRNYKWNRALYGCPQRRGRITRIFTTSPRKPNSARRQVGKIRLTTKRSILSKIPGRGKIPARYAIVLIRGHGYKDTPGVGYSMIRGALECLALFDKRRRRSIYGARKT